MNVLWELTAVSLISLVIERTLELIDSLVVLYFFPWWRAQPSLPPKMFLSDPIAETENDRGALSHGNRGVQIDRGDSADSNEPGLDSQRAGGCGTPGGTMRQLANAITYTLGSNKLELAIRDQAEAQSYYVREKRFHYLKLVHYIRKYDHFLPLPSSGVQLSALEQNLARRARVPDVPSFDRSGWARLDHYLRNQAVDPPPPDGVLTQLELLAQYCYLRNQRTYDAFSVRKQQAYSVMGVMLGMAMAYLMYWLGIIPKLSAGDPSNVSYALRTALAQGPLVRVQVAPEVVDTVRVATEGYLAGRGAEGIHWGFNGVQNLRRKEPVEPFVSRSFGPQ